MTASIPDWIANVPLKTVGVLCAVNIFGKNIESRHIALSGKRYLHNVVENVANYALNPILPDMDFPAEGRAEGIESDAHEALRNVRDCFNYILQIQIEYFKVLQRIKPGAFRSKRTGRELNINQFAALSPTLLNSEKRYLILSKIDGAQPYDLDLDWDAEFDWIEEPMMVAFRDRLILAQDAYAGTLQLSEWYNGRDRNLAIPVRLILDGLAEYFVHLGQAAYYMARRRVPGGERNRRRLIGSNLLKSLHHLERFILDMARVNIFSIVRNDLERLGEGNIAAVIKVRADDESRAGQGAFGKLRATYGQILAQLYAAIGFPPFRGRATDTTLLRAGRDFKSLFKR